jgi:hypothetical protein
MLLICLSPIVASELILAAHARLLAELGRQFKQALSTLIMLC